ncbi:MAG: hypothetical protein WCA27_02360 [Candidatus Sulfotelmatobacter sp.]
MCKHRSCRPPDLPLATRLLELAISCRVDFRLSPGEHILRRHIADGAVQMYGVVMIHVKRSASSMVNGVPDRMHSDFSELWLQNDFDSSR